jgi:hypothetical protein
VPQEYPLSIRFRAEELYVDEGLNFEKVSEATRTLVRDLCGDEKGVSVSQLKRWSEEDRSNEGKSWPEKRDERQAALRQIEREKLLLKRELLDDARRTRDPQKVYAFARLDKQTAAAVKRPQEAAAAVEIDRPALFLEDLNFITNVLKEVNPEGLKVFAESFDAIVGRFKAQYAQTA